MTGGKVKLTKAMQSLLAELRDLTNERFIGRFHGSTSAMAQKLVDSGLISYRPGTETTWPMWSLTDAGRAALTQSNGKGEAL